MNSILSEIYRGEYTAIQKHYRKGTQFARLLEQTNKLEVQIREGLPESLKAAFDHYLKASADLSYLACEEDYIAGYKLGVQMILAALEINQSSPIRDTRD